MVLKKINALTLTKAESDEDLRRLVVCLTRRYVPEKILVFGSGANSSRSTSSDIDLALIVKHQSEESICRKSLAGLGAEIGVPIDLFIYDIENLIDAAAVGGVGQVIFEDGKEIWPNWELDVAR